jgi:ADP-ribose pyrophosphatase YjhB (NUDIX family)
MDKPNDPENTQPIPSIGVGGLLFNSNKEVLLIKRNQPPAAGLWSVPGGRQESSETLVEACCREFFEETNLEVQVKQIVAVVERRLEGFHYVIIDFLVELLDETINIPTAQSDVSEAKWIKLDGLDALPLVVGLTEIIQRTHKNVSQKTLGGLHDANKTGTDFIGY